MSGTLLEAFERTERGNKTRKSGFIPGILYGSGLKESRMVKFETEKLENDLSKTSNKKIKVKLGEDVEDGFIKEVQREPVSKRVLHIDIQVAKGTDIVKVQVPVAIEGRAALESQGLILDIQSQELTIHGAEQDIPENIVVDVSNLKVGDAITVSRIKVRDGLKIVDEPTKVIASASVPKEEEVETETEDTTTNEEGAAPAGTETPAE